MVLPCRKHLFSSLNLNTELNSERFSDLLSKNPDITGYVKRLSYRLDNSISDHEMNISGMLKKLSSLQSIELWSSVLYFEWDSLDESIRSSLVSLIQLPTVTFLNIYSFSGFPATALWGCSNLIDLQIGNLILAPSEVNQVISRSKIPTPVSLCIFEGNEGLAALLNSATLHTGDPIVDFSCVQKAQFYLGCRDLLVLNELIKVTTRLKIWR